MKYFSVITLAEKSVDYYSKLASASETAMFVFYILAVVCLVAAIFMFIKFNIPKIINDLSGRTARKSIARRRSENEKSGNKSFGPTPKAKDRGTTTDKIRESEKLEHKKNKPLPKKEENATDVLEDGTELLATEESFDDGVSEQGTDVLADATELLVNNATPETEVLPSRMEIIQSVVLLHTDETIE